MVRRFYEAGDFLIKAAGPEGEEVVFPQDSPVPWRRLTEEATNDEMVGLWPFPSGGGRFSTAG